MSGATRVTFPKLSLIKCLITKKTKTINIFQQSAHLQFRAKNARIFLTNVIEVIQILFR